MGAWVIDGLLMEARIRDQVNMVRPPRIELGLRVPETLVISFSLRAPRFLYHSTMGESMFPGLRHGAKHLAMDDPVGSQGFLAPY